ncbi:TPA: hypothetical protein QFM44_000648, partial [Enterococcus faecium]
TKRKIFLLDQTLQHNEDIPTYFKKMLENSRSHHLVNVQWFEELLKDTRIESESKLPNTAQKEDI